MSEVIAYPYAKAIFTLALQHNQIDEWREFLQILVQVITDKELRSLWHAPKRLQVKILELLNEVASSMLENLKPFGENFLQLLLNKKYLNFLPQIADVYQQFYVAHNGIKNIKVVTALQLTDKQRKTINDKLQHKFKGKIEVQYVIDSTLIGGMKIKVGDEVIDGSISGMLKQFVTNIW